MSGGDLESDMYFDVHDESGSTDSSAPTEQSDVNNAVLKCTMIKQTAFEIGTYSLRARYLNDLFAHDQKFFPDLEYSSDQKKYKEELLEYEGILAKLKLKRDELGQCPISDCQIHRTSMAQPLPESPNRNAAVNQINKSAKTRPAIDDNYERPSKRHSARATTATNSFQLTTQNKFDNMPETIEEPTPPEIKIQPIMLAMTSNYNIALQNINKNFPGTNNGHVASWRGCPKFPKMTPKRGQATSNTNNRNTFQSNYINPTKSFAQILNGNSNSASNQVSSASKIVQETPATSEDLLAPLTLLKELAAITKSFPGLMQALPKIQNASSPIEQAGSPDCRNFNAN
ncbi:hypothetical protein CDAR_367541 [Caerostris darwini]|uniref:Uncharacterized protein n=1 Tax=Caerostris darwini TaxID=1538125 RepID=A0AAV4QSM8_9ARAC|nr:hypothetical protein CDAR_367541 [Caerostris darwini]